MAENIARAHGGNTAKARLAGMLHDLARLYSGERLIAESRSRGIPVSDYERRHPIVLHAPLSARLAAELFGVTDPEVQSAIAKHTLADGEMSVLDCAVYLADTLEPGRTYADRARLAAMAEIDLEATMRATIRSSLRYLKKNDVSLAPQTAAAMRRFGVRDDPTEADAGRDS